MATFSQGIQLNSVTSIVGSTTSGTPLSIYTVPSGFWAEISVLASSGVASSNPTSFSINSTVVYQVWFENSLSQVLNLKSNDVISVTGIGGLTPIRYFLGIKLFKNP